MTQVYTPIATEICRSLIWANLSWSNISTSIVNRSTTAISVVPNRELPTGKKAMMWFEEGIKTQRYFDAGAEKVSDNVEVHVFTRPSNNEPSNIGSYKRDKNHLVEEVVRVVRQNRTNASKYDFMEVTQIVPLDIENDPSIIPPYLETMVRVELTKIREALT